MDPQFQNPQCNSSKQKYGIVDLKLEKKIDWSWCLFTAKKPSLSQVGTKETVRNNIFMLKNT